MICASARKASLTEAESGNIDATSLSNTAMFAPLESREIYFPLIPLEKSYSGLRSSFFDFIIFMLLVGCLTRANYPDCISPVGV